jgi:hypothetical protein
MKLVSSILLVLLMVTACLAQQSGRGGSRSVNPAAQLKVFRGDIGNSQIEMKLRRAGENLSGTYAYDGMGQSLTLKGRIDSGGKLTLQEFDAKGRQTGKFDCRYSEQSLESPTPTIEGNWSKPDGSKQTFVGLTEQSTGLENSIRIVPKLMTEGRFGVRIVYPQIAAAGNRATADFNRRVIALIRKALGEFKSGYEPVPGKSYYVMNYNVLLASNDLVSIELNAEASAGQMYVNDDHYALTYDLRAGRSLTLDALFKPGADYTNSIYENSIKNVRARMKKLREEDGSKKDRPEDDEPSFMSETWSDWAMSSKGVFVYYELPHVAEYFERVFIPYSALKDLVNPDGPAAAFSDEKR